MKKSILAFTKTGKGGEYPPGMVCLLLGKKIVSVKCPHKRVPFADKLPLAESDLSLTKCFQLSELNTEAESYVAVYNRSKCRQTKYLLRTSSTLLCPYLKCGM